MTRSKTKTEGQVDWNSFVHQPSAQVILIAISLIQQNKRWAIYVAILKGSIAHYMKYSLRVFSSN